MSEDEKTLTAYVVLRHLGGTSEPDAWELKGTVDAVSKVAAIKAVANETPGRYRAVPLRSWKGGLEIVVPERPTPETKPFD